MKFVTNPSQHYPLKTDYNKKHLEDYINANLLGLQTHNHINWKNHTVSLSSWKIHVLASTYCALHNETSQPWRII